MSSLFCRHNRFTADCPICAKGTVLDPSRKAVRERPAKGRSVAVRRPGRKSVPAAGQAREFHGPYVAAGPYERDGEPYQVRLEKVPGGIRLAAWTGASLQPRAPVLRALDLPLLIGTARERELLPARDLEALERAIAADPADGEAAEFGASAGRSGDLREELRVDGVDEGRLRVARWLYRPGEGAWELQDAPIMVPAKRFAEALRAAARGGVLARAAAIG
ncbi:MAG: hypothetical protein QOG63_749 [Thermoleophilaceae bacterium]|nr:hypothetical protein [Thermoleophilaceae bacterium]